MADTSVLAAWKKILKEVVTTSYGRRGLKDQVFSFNVSMFTFTSVSPISQLRTGEWVVREQSRPIAQIGNIAQLGNAVPN